MELAEFQQKYFYRQSTGMMQQYLDVKFAHLDCLLLFRMGDFYELFFEDAVNASKTLGIVLTKRGNVGDLEVSMCGVPHHALEGYLHKLLEAGYKIAICDQLETPEEAKKRGGYKAVVKREVTRIITPGTILEENLITKDQPSYLASLVLYQDIAAICYVDLSTSEIFISTVLASEAINELSKIAPKELLVSEKSRNTEIISKIHKSQFTLLTYQVDSFFSTNKCRKIILDFYKIKSLDGIGAITDVEISAIGGVLEYLYLTQKHNLPILPLPKIVNHSRYMMIDAATRRNLEIMASINGKGRVGSLFDVLNKTMTTAGGRLLYQFLMSPLSNVELINQRLEITDFFYKHDDLRSEIRQLLKNSADIERCFTRIAMQRSLPVDLLAIKYTLDIATKIKAVFLALCGMNLPEYIENIVVPLAGDDELYELINSAIIDEAPNNLSNGGFIKTSYHPKLSELYDLINNNRQHIEKLKQKYQQETGIDNLKIVHNNVLGLFIEVTARMAGKVDNTKFIHRQTTANAVRYTTIQLQQLESDMVNAKTLAISLENELYRQICEQAIKKAKILQDLAISLNQLDVFTNLAHIAYEYNYTRPEIYDDICFEVKGGRHPVIERVIQKNAESFVQNDCILSQEERIWLITGPNMAGKSTFLRQNALISIIAQIGSFVPANSAKIGVVDKIFSRIGAGDDLVKGQSTFMVEMLEVANILAQGTERSLLILDEVGRGTATYDGVAIAWATLEYIHDKLRSRCLFATHYHELTSMSKYLLGLKNYTVAIEEEVHEIIFLHNIIAGAADKSYGVHVAKIAGLPNPVIKRANEILQKFEKENIKKQKEILKDSSNNLSLFDLEQIEDVNSDITKIGSASVTENTKCYGKLLEQLAALQPDSLSPKEALDVIYQLKKLYDTKFRN